MGTTMPGYAISKVMMGWNPISVIILGGFALFCFCVVWFTVSNVQPPAWIISLGSVAFGAANFAVGGVLTAMHGESVANKTLEVKNGATSI